MKTIFLFVFFYVGMQSVYAQTLIRGPYLQVATSSSIHIRWRTDIPAGSRVRYGLSQGSLNMTDEDLPSKTEHELTISGLTPSTQYWYSIETASAVLQGNADNYFYTLPTPGSKALYRIGALGDCGNNSTNQVDVRNALITYLGNNYMNAWLLLGDNAYPNGRDDDYSSGFFNIYRDKFLKQNPLFTSPGNHDYDAGGSSLATRSNVPYHKLFSMPIDGEAGGTASGNKAFYSFDIGNIHFLSLDSYGRETSATRLYDTTGPQVTWVKQDLDNNTNKDWIIAYWHHPPYTMGSHNSDSEAELVNIRSNFIRILERYGVDLIICGHSHVYERSRLMKGNYGMETTFSASQHNVSPSNGLYDGTPGSCPYVKRSAFGNEGTVYVVSGSAGQKQQGTAAAPYPHNAMFYSNNTEGGAVMLEIQDNRLDLKWICADGVIRDKFTMMKEVGKNTTYNIELGQSVQLAATYTGNYNWPEGETTSSIMVTPATEGTSQYIVKDNYECVSDTFNVVASAVLPVAWGSIKCHYEKSANANIIQWELLSQQNNKQFNIERSTNGSLFESVGIIDVASYPGGTNTYSFADKNIDVNRKYYYRIKQTDKDGKFSYSDIVVLNRAMAHDFEVQILPNPASANEVKICLSAGPARTAILKLTNINGKLIRSTSMLLNSTQQSFMPQVQAGIYFISVSTPGYAITKQIVIR